jgi:hypothetical protein
MTCADNAIGSPHTRHTCVQLSFYKSFASVSSERVYIQVACVDDLLQDCGSTIVLKWTFQKSQKMGYVSPQHSSLGSAMNGVEYSPCDVLVGVYRQYSSCLVR